MTPTIATNNSVAGNVHHTPVIFAAEDKTKAIGITTIKPRSIEIILAGSG